MEPTGTIIAAGAAIGVLATWWRWGYPRWVATRMTAKEFRDAVLGRPPVLHPDTGNQLAPAVPGIGARQANMEDQLVALTAAVTQLAETNRLVVRLTDEHEQLAERVTHLENATAERLVARTESVGLLRTIESAINAQPPVEPQA